MTKRLNREWSKWKIGREIAYKAAIKNKRFGGKSDLYMHQIREVRARQCHGVFNKKKKEKVRERE